MSEIRIVSNYRKRLAKFGIMGRANTSHYLALVVKLEKRLSSRKLGNTAIWRSFVKKKKKKKLRETKVIVR